MPNTAGGCIGTATFIEGKQLHFAACNSNRLIAREKRMPYQFREVHAALEDATARTMVLSRLYSWRLCTSRSNAAAIVEVVR